MLDVLIQGGWVADGSGSPRFPADVAIEGDRIVDVARHPLDGAQAKRVINATGKIVCPGFVDVNGHSDWTVFPNPTQESTVRQGVTTEVVGNCGNGFAPVSDLSRAFISARLAMYAFDDPVEWSSYAEYLEHIRGIGTSNNFGFLIGHNTLRLAAGVTASNPTEDEMRRMEDYVREAMDAGALGMSSGLEFEPGLHSTTDELVRLARVVGGYDGFYASHIRNRDEFLQQAVDEFLTIAREAGTHAEIGHLNVRHNTGAADGAWQRAVDSVERARQDGVDVLADTTPFPFGTGLMVSILPAWVTSQGPARMAELLGDRDVRASLRTECDRYWRFIHRGEWHRVYIQGDRRFPEFDGKHLGEIAAMQGKDPWDAYFDILLATGDEMESMQAVGVLFTEEHLAEMIRHPLFNLTSDTWSSRIDGPLAQQTRHPICFAGHIHFLTHHVRECGTLRLEDAIRKLTSMPAGHFGLRGRGLLREGAFADVVVFDFKALEDGSTLQEPLTYARGVEHVFVNGTAVLEGGNHTGARPGRILIR